MTLFGPIFRHAAGQPLKVAITDDRGRYTYQQLAMMAAEMSSSIASNTRRLHVGLLLPAGVAFVASFYGTLLARKTVVPLNFLLGDREIAHVVADSGIDAVLTVPPLASRLKDLPLNVVDVTQIARASMPDPQSLPAPSADDVAVLMYTSGTSGLPKGVPLTYGNLQSDVDASIAHANFDGSHTFLGLFHCSMRSG
jgi:long-chain acyl-CoA synthetase